MILGYTCANDVTLRDLQKTDDQWARAKGFDGSCPLGPWVETDVDPNDVRLWTRLNGDTVQSGQSHGHGVRRGDADRVHHLVHDAPAGRRAAHRDARGRGARCSDGDVVEVEVEGVGHAVELRGGHPRERRCGAGSRRRRAARSTWATSAARSSRGCGRATTTARSSCAWRTPMPAASPRRPCTACWRICAGWDSTGTRAPTSGARTGPTGSRSGSTSTATTADRLLAQGDAYRCYCTSEELEERREAAMARGEAPGLRRPLSRP